MTGAPVTGGSARTMDTTDQPVVLCVDDEPQVLGGLAVHLRRRYQLLTAGNGFEGLQLLASHPEIAVVVSDMRMPGMNGGVFLHKVRERAPDTVRILLTGQADLDSAIAAVNEGQIFRFLTKPCPMATLLASVNDAVEQHRLITSERVLLEQTLRGIVKTLTDVLALTNPVSFGRGSRIKARVTELAAALQLPDRWQVEVAAMLSQLGYIALEPETAAQVYRGGPLTKDQAQAVARVPAITEQLLSNIPRLETVRAILAGYSAPYRPPTPGEAETLVDQVARAAHLLKVAIDFDALETQHHSAHVALQIMRERRQEYDPAVLAAIHAAVGPESTESWREVKLTKLEVGMVFAEDVMMDGDTLLVARGLEVTPGMVERMRNVREGSVTDTVRIIVPRTPED